MKNRLKQIGIVLAMVVAMLIGLNLWLIDGINGLFWGSLFKEDTVYAVAYTDSGWRAVRIGMAEDDVRRLIGQPLQVWTNEDATVSMGWSRSPGDTHYRCRALEFSKGRVAAKYAEFYVD